MISKKNFLLFFFLLLTAQYIIAQNINGVEISVSKEKLSSITFHSDVTNYYFEQKNSPYKVSTLGSDAIVIQTAGQVKDPCNFFVAEGGRKHRFVIVYKNDIDISEQDHDYSDLKQLDKLVKDFNGIKANPPSQNTSAPANKNNNNTNTNVQPANNNETNNNVDGSSNDNSFIALVTEADKAKKDNQLQAAKAKYEQALQIQPDNSYAQAGLHEVNNAIANELALKHSDLMIKANNAFSSNRYDEALKDYSDALTIQPDDKYAAAQINLVKKMQEVAKIDKANQEKDNSFNSYISAGDKALSGKEYNTAVIAYNEALKIKPGNATAKSRIDTVKQKMYADSLDADRKTKDDLYNSFLNSGNKALQEKLYDQAGMAYNEALKIKPGDAFIKSKLNEIDEQLRADSLQAENTKNKALYDNYIKSGDDAFKNNLYDVAKSDYSEALKINSNDEYAKAQIKKSDDAMQKSLLQAQKNLETQKNQEHEKQYNDLIAAADNYYNSGMYAEARDAYNKALAVNNKDVYSKNKISQIDNLFSQQKEAAKQDSLNNIKYSEVILKADAGFNNKDYANAKLFYSTALKYKNYDAYAKDRLAQIAAALQEIAEKDQAAKDSAANEKENTKQYNDAILKAKAAYSKNDYVMARGFYVNAANLKPAETEPKNKITEIDNKFNEIEQQKQQKDLFDSLSDAANISLADSEYTSAIYNYTEALKLNQPDQAYYINKQIDYAKKQLALKDSLNLITKKTGQQQQNLDSAMAIYKKGKDALKFFNYNDELLYFQQFINYTDSLGLTSDNIKSLVDFSKRKVNDIQQYLQREAAKKLSGDTLVHKLPDIKDLPSVIVIYYPNPKDPKLDAVYKKYPDINFNQPPDDQLFDSIDLSQENKLKSKDIMSATPVVISENINNGIKLTCQNIILKGEKVYIKLMLQNSTEEEFLTGSMLLTQKTQNGNSIRIPPNYISGYPIILAHQQKIIVYVSKYKEISNNDNLEFEIADRLNKNKITVTVPGNVYNRERKNVQD